MDTPEVTAALKAQYKSTACVLLQPVVLFAYFRLFRCDLSSIGDSGYWNVALF